MKPIAYLFLTLLMAALSEADCATPATAPAATTSPQSTISIRDFSFSPASVTITAGSKVVWKNLDGEPHTVRSVDADFRSDALDQNDSFEYTFNKPGTYHYICSIHPQMVGTIVVKSAGDT